MSTQDQHMNKNLKNNIEPEPLKPSPKASPESGKGKGPLKRMAGKKPGDRNTFTNNILGAILVFLAIIALYTYTAGPSIDVQKISITELASDVAAGKVTEISVSEDQVEATYKDNTKKETKKEAQTSLIETFANLGVQPERISAVKIDNTEDRGFGYWMANTLPFVFPILLFFFMIWFLTRQARGAGVQALSFGQSRARMTLPEDNKVKITFKDVAGANEYHEELL